MIPMTRSALLLCLPAFAQVAGSEKKALEFIQAYNAGEPQLKAVLMQMLSPEALKARPLDVRLGAWRSVREEQGTLDVKASRHNGASTEVLVRGASGEWSRMTFEWEPTGHLNGMKLQPAEPNESLEPPAPLSEAAFKTKVLDFLQQRVDAEVFSGCVLVTRGEKLLLHQSYGFADRGLKVPNAADTKFNLGSLNKLFTRVAILQLLQAGKVGLEDPLGKFVPDYANAEACKKVTVRHLINMAGGIGDFFGPAFEAASKARFRTNADFIPLFENQSLAFPPGTQRAYSNGGYILLGAIIEKVSGQSYYDYVHDHVFEPAGMKDTASYQVDEVVANRATGYTKSGKGPWRANTYGLPARGSAAGGGYSTAPDLLRFVRALQSHRLLNPALSAWMLNGGDMPAILPTEVMKPQGPSGWAGGTMGVNTTLVLDPVRDAVIIVLSNLEPPSAMDVSQKIEGWMRAVN